MDLDDEDLLAELDAQLEESNLRFSNFNTDNHVQSRNLFSFPALFPQIIL